MPVLRDHDRAFHRNAHPLQLLVVFRNSVIHKDQRRCNVAINRICVVGWQLLALLAGSWILRNRRLLQLRDKFRPAFDQFDGPLFRRGEQNVKGLDVRIETELLEFRRQPFRIVLVVCRSNIVRPRRKPLHVVAHQLRIRNRLEPFLPLPLRT
jgi:hypothetical protein